MGVGVTGVQATAGDGPLVNPALEVHLSDVADDRELLLDPGATKERTVRA